jgi:hypothetical protein
MERIPASWQSLSALVLALAVLPSCNAINPLCGSARPAPVLASLSPATATFAQTQQGLPLTLSGSHFVTSSVVIINGTTLSTTITSAQQLQTTIPTTLITAPGNANVTVKTPSGTTGDLGCSSGGTSHALVLTIT